MSSTYDIETIAPHAPSALNHEPSSADDVLNLVSTICEHPQYGGIFRAISQRCTDEAEAYVGFPAYRSQVNDGIFCMTKQGLGIMEIHGEHLRLRDITVDDLQSLDSESIHAMACEAKSRVLAGRLGRARRSFH